MAVIDGLCGPGVSEGLRREMEVLYGSVSTHCYGIDTLDSSTDFREREDAATAAAAVAAIAAEGAGAGGEYGGGGGREGGGAQSPSPSMACFKKGQLAGGRNGTSLKYRYCPPPSSSLPRFLCLSGCLSIVRCLYLVYL